jgi:CRP/FNR family cyclic AMP-dependent transcriptional regulator
MSRIERKGIVILSNAEPPRFAKHSSVYPTLQRCALFEDLSSSVLSELTSISTYSRESRRERIYTQGEKGAYIFVVSRGRVRVFRDSGKDRLFTIAYRGVGELIGESLLGHEPIYQDTAVASEQVELIRLPLANVEELIESNSRFARKLLRLIVNRCLEMEQRLERLFVKTIESRIAEFLLEASAQYGIPESRGTMIGAKYTHQEIADYVGSTRETVTLVLGQLKRRGLILTDHRQLVVRNEKGLEKLSDSRRA